MALFDIEPLLLEISPDAPCGDNLEYDAAFIALEGEAKGTPEKQVGDRIEPAVPPNWKNVRKQVLELLARTRDLRLLLELARTGLNMDGLAGLQQGVSLLRQSLEAYWDSIHPQLDPDDDNDPTLRVNIIAGLCDNAAFLRPLLTTPLVESRAVGRFSLRDIQIANGKLPAPEGEEPPQWAMIQGAFSDVPLENVQATQQALKDSLADINAIENFLTAQVGVGNAPSLAPIRNQLKEALHAVDEQMQRLGAGEGGAEDAADLAEESGGADSPVVGGAKKASAAQIGEVNSRQDVIRLLDLICEYYARHEPSSPVPLLARRAKRLVTMDFMAIMQDLAPGGLGEVEVIKGPEPDEE